MAPTGNTLVTTNGIHGASTRPAVAEDVRGEPHSFVSATLAQDGRRENGTDEKEAVIGPDGYVVESIRFQGGHPGPDDEAEEESWLAFKAAVILASLASLKIHHPSFVGPARRGTTTTTFAGIDAFSVGVIENSACVITLSLTSQELDLHPIASLQQLIVSRLTEEPEQPRQLPIQSAPDGLMLLIDFSSPPDAQSEASGPLAQRFPMLLQLCRHDRRLRAIGGHRSYGEGYIHPNLASWFLLHAVHYLDEIRILSSSTSAADPSRSTRRLASVQISPLEKALLLQLSRTPLTPQQINAARPPFVQHFLRAKSLPELILRSSQINQSLLALHWFERAKASSHPNPHKQHSTFELTFTFKQFAHYSYLLSEYLWKKIAWKGVAEDGKDQTPIVCLLMNKNPWMVLIMFAVSLTGASYLNLELSTPINKIKAILTRLDVTLLLTFQRYDPKPQPNVDPDGPLSSLTRILDLSEHCQGLQARLLEAVSGGAGTHDAGLRDPHEILALYEARMRWRDGESKASTAYIVYTSGTTGEPKPIKISHANLLQFLFNYATRFQRKNDGLTRVLQFASYAFDVSVMSIWDTLAHGATICMTTEENLKSDLIGTMISLGCTTVDLTPTVLGVLLEDDLFRGTEKMAREKVAERWAREGFRLIHVNTGAERVSGELRREFLARGVSVCVDYGPSETTVGVVSSLQTLEDHQQQQQQQQGAGTALEDIGRPTGLNEIYILKPQEAELARLGEVGEICVGGGQVAAGYVDDTLPSQRKFIEINLFDQSQPIRLYRTGDLGKFLPTGSEGCGSICCLGRMDSQVKISGVRIELGELEQRLNQLSHRLPSLNDHHLRAIVSKWDDGQHPARLVCFIELHSKLPRSLLPVAPSANDPLHILSLSHDRDYEEWFQGLVAEIKEAVRDDLSAGMIPRHWIPVNRIPISYTGKVDRRALNSLLEPYFRRCESREERSNGRGMTGSESLGRCAQMAAEAWSVGLGRHGDTRFKDTDNFIRLGGDSIGMMRAIGTLRRKGMSGVRFSTLAHAADFSAFVNILQEHAQEASSHTKSSHYYAPFASLTTIEKEAVLNHLDHVHSITKDEIEDCYHISPTQAGIISASLQDEYKEEKVGIYFSQAVYTIHSSFSSESLARNMLRRVAIHPALRTIFVWPDPLPHILQVVLNYSSTRIEKHIDIAKVEREADFLSQLETYLREDRERRQFKWGRLCMSMKIFECEESEQRRLVWSLHHALSDGLTLEILMEELMSEFSGEGEGNCFSERKQRTQYREFVEAWRTRPAGPKIHQFWQSYLEGVPKHMGNSSTSFTTTQHRSTKWLLGQKTLDELQLAHGITPAIALRLMIAIGLFNGGYAGPDVVFGMVRSGREVELEADGLAEEVVGCCVSVLPIRTKIFERKFRERSLLEALLLEKEMEKEMGKHQMVSMGEVGRRTTGHGEWLDTLVTIQGWRRQEGRRAIKQPPDLIRMPTPYRLSIEVSMEEDGQTISIDLFFDKHSFPVGSSPQSAEHLLAHLLSSLSHLSSCHHHQPIQTLLNRDMCTEKLVPPSSPVSNGHPLPNQQEAAVQQDQATMKMAKMEEIWIEVLGLTGSNPSALAHRSFEELGGDSIGMMRLMNRIKLEFFEDTAQYYSHEKFRTLFQEINHGIHLNHLVHLL